MKTLMNLLVVLVIIVAGFPSSAMAITYEFYGYISQPFDLEIAPEIEEGDRFIYGLTVDETTVDSEGSDIHGRYAPTAMYLYINGILYLASDNGYLVISNDWPYSVSWSVDRFQSHTPLNYKSPFQYSRFEDELRISTSLALWQISKDETTPTMLDSDDLPLFAINPDLCDPLHRYFIVHFSTIDESGYEAPYNSLKGYVTGSAIVPEPATLPMIGLGIAAAALLRCRRRSSRQ